MPRTYLFVPRKDETLAKAMGAKWDSRRQHWHVPTGVNPEPFSKWRRDRWLTLKQRHFANQLCDLFRFDIPHDIRYERKFGKRFLDLFGFDPKNLFFPTGMKRVKIIKSYIEEDEYLEHLGTKFDIAKEDIVFMIKVMTEYGGDINRDNGRRTYLSDVNFSGSELVMTIPIN